MSTVTEKEICIFSLFGVRITLKSALINLPVIMDYLLLMQMYQTSYKISRQEVKIAMLAYHEKKR